MLSKLECVIIRNYDCDLADDSSPRSPLILSTLENWYRVLPKDNDFTFVRTSGSVSNIDNVACTLNVSGRVSVLIGNHSTNHIPIEACVNGVYSEGKKYFTVVRNKRLFKGRLPSLSDSARQDASEDQNTI